MIKINFLQKQSLKKKNERIRFLVIVSYICIWIFSLYMIAHSYKVNDFIKEIYEAEAQKIENDIQKIKPNIDTLKKLSNEIDTFEQEIYKIEKDLAPPIHAAAFLLGIAKLMPEKIWLEDVNFEPLNDNSAAQYKRQNGKKIMIKGAYFLGSNRPDLKYINDFLDTIKQNTDISDEIQDLKIQSSEITHVYNKQAVSFLITGIWSPSITSRMQYADEFSTRN